MNHQTMKGQDILNKLRQERFNQQTETILSMHPFLLAAEKGSLTNAQRKAFAQEQYFIQLSDAISFASLAGHLNFNPSSLTNVLTPTQQPNDNNKADIENNGKTQDLFQFLLGGEIFASSLLLDYAKHFDLDEASLAAYSPIAKAQGYPSYWSRLALSKNRAAGAAACAVNFPAWGEMCRRLYDALQNQDLNYGYDINDKALAFIRFFASPIEDLDKMAVAVLEEENATYEEVVDHVRLLQEYEVLFWDAIYEVK